MTSIVSVVARSGLDGFCFLDGGEPLLWIFPFWAGTPERLSAPRSFFQLTWQQPLSDRVWALGARAGDSNAQDFLC